MNTYAKIHRYITFEKHLYIERGYVAIAFTVRHKAMIKEHCSLSELILILTVSLFSVPNWLRQVTLFRVASRNLLMVLYSATAN